MQKPGIFGTLQYSEGFHNCISTHILKPVIFTKISKRCVTLEIHNPSIQTTPEFFRTLAYLKPDTYSEPFRMFKIERFAKIVKSCYYLFKTLNHIGFILKRFVVRHIFIANNRVSKSGLIAKLCFHFFIILCILVVFGYMY